MKALILENPIQNGKNAWTMHCFIFIFLIKIEIVTRMNLNEEEKYTSL